MSPNRRIFLNIIATYGRSLYAMAIGLFTSRWILEALGHVDYGLMGVVGGLTGLVSFFNGLLAESVSRFYAFSVGREHSADSSANALEECRSWFTIAFVLHTIIPVVLIIVGYPIGLWMVKHWLVIPPDRVDACVWVWRISCASCFAAMISVPFQAMYTAKQEIAELTVYSFVTTTVSAIFFYYMAAHPSDWLVRYSFWSMVISISPMVIICIRSVIKYPECRLRVGALCEWTKYRELFVYAGSRFFGAVSQLATSQGMALVVNKLLGPARNAAMAIGWTMTSKTMTLKESFCCALEPAITNAAGAGDYERVRSLAFRTCMLTPAAIAVFALPLILEIDEVMILWLKNPPELSGRLCQLWLIAYLIDQMTMGHVFAMFAKGKIVFFQVGEGIIWISALWIAWAGMHMGLDISAVGIGWIVMFSLDNVLKIYCARKEIGMSIRHWAGKIVIPLCSVFALTSAIGWTPHMFLEQSVLRLFVTGAVCEIAFIPLAWFFLLGIEDRTVLAQRMSRVLHLKNASVASYKGK